jgi:hypothetical protein
MEARVDAPDNGAAPTAVASFNFLLLINPAFFKQFPASQRQFRNDLRLTLPRARRQDATDFAAAN